MKTMWFMCLVLCVAFGNTSEAYRLLPRRAVMFGGYYSNPIFGRTYDVIPRGAMSAVVTRDAVATNTYAGEVAPPQYPPLDTQLPPEENETVERFTEKTVELLQPQYGVPEAPQRPGDVQTPTQVDLGVPPEEILRPAAPSEAALVDDVVEEVSTETATKATKRLGKKKVVKPPTPPVQEEEDEEEEEGLPAAWPFASRRGVPSYNAFFPITISGGSSARGRPRQGQSSEGGLEDYIPGSATAIANSFSTGKGGIATSHATSFGDPYLASLVRNGLLSFRTKKPQES